MVEIRQAWFITSDRPQFAGKTTMPIDLLQQLLDADARQAGFDRVAELARAFRDFQCIGTFDLQPPVAHRSERVFSQSVCRTSGRLGVLLSQPAQYCLRFGRQNQSTVGSFPLGGPTLFVVDQVPERNV